MDMAIDLSDADEYPVSQESPDPFQRKKISEIMSTGVRVIDGLLTVGQDGGSVFLPEVVWEKYVAWDVGSLLRSRYYRDWTCRRTWPK